MNYFPTSAKEEEIFVNTTEYPICLSFAPDNSESCCTIEALFTSASRYVFHVQNFVICRDEASEF